MLLKRAAGRTDWQTPRIDSQWIGIISSIWACNERDFAARGSICRVEHFELAPRALRSSSATEGALTHPKWAVGAHQLQLQKEQVLGGGNSTADVRNRKHTRTDEGRIEPDAPRAPGITPDREGESEGQRTNTRVPI